MQYIIASLPRTGSFMLCDLLSQCGAGSPDEHFHPYQGAFSKALVTSCSTEDYAQRITSEHESNGIFSSKIMSKWLELMRLNMSTPTFNNAEMLNKLFPDAKYIFLTRRDRARQAISFYRASDTGQWAQRQGQDSREWQTPAFNDRLGTRIRSTIFDLLRLQQEWLKVFHDMGVSPCEVCYEDLVTDSEQTLTRVFNYLELDAPDFNAVTSFQRQSDSKSDELLEQFLRWQVFQERGVSVG